MLCLPNCFLSALPHNPDKQPTVRIQQGTVTGLTDANYGIDQFFGIPFGKPPTGDLRFAKPVAVEPSPKSDADATRFGDICMQPSRAEPTLYKVSENCLNLNIVRSQEAFVSGNFPSFNASELVQKSVETGKPIVFVAMNYRTGPFGFIGGSEVAASDSATTNAGLYDQRSALQSVQNNIPSFVGDPNKVTLFGESAGAMSMALQTIAYDGQTEGLYHAAIMASGASAPGPLLTPKRPTVEKTFKDLTARVGCTANASAVQQAATVLTGIDPIAGALAFLPLVDYKLITNYPSVQLPQGKLADIPVIQGNNLDEGTLFGQKTLNSSTEFETWVRSAAVIYNTSYAETALQQVFENYPDVPSEASPYYNAETATSAGTTQNLDSRIYEPFASDQYKRSSSFYVCRGEKLLQLKGDNITAIPDTYRKEAIAALVNKDAAGVSGF
ncbi:related to Lipase 2 precursor [Ustilago bromivora]|uniref:Related to Lipase 2 n=1 Tax=Ustilago bromivora TaxID=307758 RepID=A0A8H8QJG1_9BASI|nr:related to Lipase 2 precursor [Ustilago bromivora]